MAPSPDPTEAPPTIGPLCWEDLVSLSEKTSPQTETSLHWPGLEPWRGRITSTPLVVSPSIRPSCVLHFGAFSCGSRFLLFPPAWLRAGVRTCASPRGRCSGRSRSRRRRCAPRTAASSGRRCGRRSGRWCSGPGTRPGSGREPPRSPPGRWDPRWSGRPDRKQREGPGEGGPAGSGGCHGGACLSRPTWNMSAAPSGVYSTTTVWAGDSV